MASLAILQLCFEYIPEKSLEDNMHVSNYHICYLLTYFIILCRLIVVKYFIPSLSSFAPQVTSLLVDGNCV